MQQKRGVTINNLYLDVENEVYMGMTNIFMLIKGDRE